MNEIILIRCAKFQPVKNVYEISKIYHKYITNLYTEYCFYLFISISRNAIKSDSYLFKRKNNTAYTILAREMAPGAADENMYVPENKSSTEGKQNGEGGRYGVRECFIAFLVSTKSSYLFRA